MKKCRFLSGLFLMVGLLFALSTAAFAGAGDTIYAPCNLYASASTGAAVVRYLGAGDACTVDEQRGEWTAIITLDQVGNHVDGWVQTKNLTATGCNYRTYTPTYYNNYPPQTVTSGNAHTVLTATMHAGPAEYRDPMGTIPANQPIIVLGDEGNGWSRVSYNGVTGYISSAAISYYSTSNSYYSNAVG